MRIIFAAEIILTVGILLFAVSILFAGLIIKRLLKIIRHKGIWIFFIMGSLLMLLGSIVHIIKLTVYFPALAASTPYDLLPLIAQTMKVGTVEASMILIAGIFTIIGSLIYFRWTST